MSDYIEVGKILEFLDAETNALNSTFDEIGGEAGAYVACFKDVRSYIERFPTADVEPVVRCKACVHWEGDPDTYSDDNGVKGFCMNSFERTNEDDFCSLGERKTT